MLPDPADTPPLEPVLDVTPAAPTREPFWGYVDLALVVGLTFGLLVIVASLVMTVYRGIIDTTAPALLLLSNVVLYVFIYLAFRLVFALRYDKPVFSSLGWRSSHFQLWMAAVGGVILAFAVAILAGLLHTPQVKSPIDALTKSPLWLVLFGIMAVTLAPLFEELFFRGFVQPLLSRTFGTVAGVLLTAAFFGGLHAPEYSWAWQYALAVAVVGAVLGWVRARSGSIIPSTVMHGCYNAAFVVALAISKHS